MKKYIIMIEETVSESFEVFAETEEIAEKIALEKYNSGEFVIAPGNLVTKQMQIYNVADVFSDFSKKLTFTSCPFDKRFYSFIHFKHLNNQIKVTRT